MSGDSYTSCYRDILRSESVEGFSDGIATSKSFFDRFQGNRLKCWDIILRGHSELENSRNRTPEKIPYQQGGR